MIYHANKHIKHKAEGVVLASGKINSRQSVVTDIKGIFHNNKYIYIINYLINSKGTFIRKI